MARVHIIIKKLILKNVKTNLSASEASFLLPLDVGIRLKNMFFSVEIQQTRKPS